MMLLLLVLVLCLTSVIQVISLSAPRVNVSKLKTDQSKMKSQLTRHNTREQALASKEALLPKFGGKGDKEVREDNGYTFFELLVRRVGTGPWLRYLDLDGDVDTETMVTNVINGGVENELWRGKLDDFIRSSLFGIGIGGETVAISKVKSALPQLKKVRSREIQFGYRIALNDESVYSVEFTHTASVIDKAIEKKALRGLPARIDVISLMQQRDDDIDQDQQLDHDHPTKLDAQDSQQGVMSSVAVSEPTYASSMAAVQTLLHTLVASMTAAEATSCVLFSDGSATIYDGPTTSPSPTPLPLTAESKAVISFSAASCGVYILPMRNMQPLYDISGIYPTLMCLPTRSTYLFQSQRCTTHQSIFFFSSLILTNVHPFSLSFSVSAGALCRWYGGLPLRRRTDCRSVSRRLGAYDANTNRAINQ